MRGITAALNWAEYLKLEAAAKVAGLSVPAYGRALLGLEPWSSRRHVIQEREDGPRKRMALDRVKVTIMVTDQEWARLRAEAREARGLLAGGEEAQGLSLPQYLRARWGFRVRWTSKPNTYERDVEENDAIEILESLGLNPADFFPEGYLAPK